MNVDNTPGPTAFECGKNFQLPTAATALTLTAQFPGTATSGDEVVTGVVDVVATSAVAGVASPQADAFLVRDGRIVTVPLPQDSLGVRYDQPVGEPWQVPATASLLACGPAGGPVPPGLYQLYTRILLTPDEGPGLEAYGGPWPLDVQ